jgi:glycosyltransferase involved in cell wall biosynthesis
VSASGPVVAYNALHVRPGVYDGAATFSLNVARRLPDALPGARVVAYVVEDEHRLQPTERLEVRPIGTGAVRAGGRVALETLWLGLELRQVGADVLVSPHESIPFLPPCPVVVVAQNLVYHRSSFGDPFRGRERRERARTRLQAAYYRRRMGDAYAKAAAVVAVSEHTADVLEAHAHLDRSKTTVVPNGADSDFLADGGATVEREPRLLTVSTLAPYKNLEETIDVFARLRERRPELTLSLAGGDWHGYRAVLEQHAQELGIGGAIRFHGVVGPTDLAQLYRTSLLLLHLSECESFGLPPVEAMRFGLPVVAADRSSLPEVTSGAALLVDPHDLDAVSAAVERVLDGEAAELVERGRRRVSTLTWDDTARGVADVVRRVLAGAPR